MHSYSNLHRHALPKSLLCHGLHPCLLVAISTWCELQASLITNPCQSKEFFSLIHTCLLLRSVAMSWICDDGMQIFCKSHNYIPAGQTPGPDFDPEEGSGAKKKWTYAKYVCQVEKRRRVNKAQHFSARTIADLTPLQELRQRETETKQIRMCLATNSSNHASRFPQVSGVVNNITCCTGSGDPESTRCLLLERVLFRELLSNVCLAGTCCSMAQGRGQRPAKPIGNCQE